MGSSGASGEDLLEREEALERLSRALTGAASGAGTLLLVEGPAGIGKTSLLRAARREAAERGLRVLAATGAESERTLAFGVVRQLFEPRVVGTPAEESADLFAGAAALARGALDIGKAVTEEADQFAVLHGLYWLTANLTDRGPLLVSIDDAHWADSPSMRFVEYVHRRLEGMPICVLVAARSEETGKDQTVLNSLRAQAEVPRVELSPLGSSSVLALAHAALGAAATANAARSVHSATGGNPFYVKALLAASRERPPEETAATAPDVVRRFVLAQLGRLGTAAEVLAEAVAVLGAVPVRQAAHLSGLDVPQAEQLADRLAAAGLFGDGPELDFAHPIVRSAVYGAIPAGRRSGEHRRAARMLAEDGADPDIVASHLLAVEAAADDWVLEQLVRAAGHAAGRGSPDAAVTYLRRALSEPPRSEHRGRILRELSTLLLRVGSAPDAADVAYEALDLASGPAERAEAAIALREILTYSGRADEVLEPLGPVVAQLAEEDPARALEVELAALASSVLHVNTSAVVAGRVRELGKEMLAGRLTHPHAVALVTMGLIFQAGTPAHVLAPAASDAAARWHTLPAPAQQRFVNHMLPALLALGLYDTAREMYDRAIAEARRLGSATQFSAWLTWRAFAQHLQGSLLESEADARGALDAVGGGQPLFAPFDYTFLILAALERGDVAGAEASYRAAGSPAGAITSVFPAFLRWSAMRLRAAQGAFDEARDGLMALGESLEAMCMPAPALIPWRSDLAIVLLRCGDRQRAAAFAEQELSLARSFRAPRPLGIALRAAGLVEGGPGGRDHLRESVDLLEGSGTSLEHARSLVELGAALRRAGERREARGHLAAGWDRARACHATRLAELAREELRAAGGRPRREALRGRDSLTASELRIARMAAAGKSNPEIAQALFVTRKTVETHLGHVYPKLGIKSRAELAAALEAPSSSEKIGEAPR